jgi:phenylalanyl-tRNA synthetase alpha chain
MFHQVEGLWIGENVSFKDLKVVYRLLQGLLRDRRPDPALSAQLLPVHRAQRRDRHPVPSGPLAGKWLEVSGSGQVHPQVVRNMGLDPERYIGFAFGSGIDRLTMLRYGVNDLRLFFEGDTRFLSQFR